MQIHSVNSDGLQRLLVLMEGKSFDFCTVPNCLDKIVATSYIMGHEIALQRCNILVAEFNNKIINFEKSHLSHKF